MDFWGLISLISLILPTTGSTSKSAIISVSNVQYNNETSTTKAVEKVQNAVVSVINYQKSANNSLGAIFGNIESSDELAVAGEGLELSIKDGQYAYIVTNTHVINNAEKIDIL